MGGGRGGGAIDELSEDEKRALRGSKFAPLTSLPSSSRSQPPRFIFFHSLGFFFFFFSRFLDIKIPTCLCVMSYRLAHPGGPLKTNKAAALAKFLERKLQDPNGLSSIDPDLLELAVKNARDTVISSAYFKKSIP